MGLLLLQCCLAVMARDRGYWREARLECGPLESGDASVLPHNVGLLELELEGEDDAGRLLCAGLKGSSTVLCREG